MQPSTRVETTRARFEFVKKEKCRFVYFAFGWTGIFIGREDARKHPYIKLYYSVDLKKLESYCRENEDRFKRILQNTTEFEKKIIVFIFRLESFFKCYSGDTHTHTHKSTFMLNGKYILYCHCW